jgi:hypothetical protein
MADMEGSAPDRPFDQQGTYDAIYLSDPGGAD